MTQGMVKAQAIQFWYGILNKKLKCQVWDAMLIQPATHFGQCVPIIGTR
jgi:hypothetical protein